MLRIYSGARASFPMSTFLITMPSRRPMATKPHESNAARLEGGISIACLASRPGQVLITTLRLGSSGVLSGIARSVHGALEEISAGRFLVRCGACVSVCRPRPVGYTGNIQRDVSARSLFRSEVRTDRAGKSARSARCSAAILVPSSERELRPLLDLVLA